MTKKLLVVLSLVACGGVVPVPPVTPKPPPALTLSLVAGMVEQLQVADSLIMNVSWINPVDDGRGPPDSLRLRYIGIFLDSSIVFRAPFPTSSTVRQMIPPQAYSGVGSSAQFDVWVQMQVWRRGLFSVATSPTILVPISGVAPQPVTGLNFSAIKKP